jgi:hypothetical protein
LAVGPDLDALDGIAEMGGTSSAYQATTPELLEPSLQQFREDAWP